MLPSCHSASIGPAIPRLTFARPQGLWGGGFTRLEPVYVAGAVQTVTGYSVRPEMTLKARNALLARTFVRN